MELPRYREVFRILMHPENSHWWSDSRTVQLGGDHMGFQSAQRVLHDISRAHLRRGYTIGIYVVRVAIHEPMNARCVEVAPPKRLPKRRHRGDL